MHLRIGSPPSLEELPALTPHEIVRDFPESLAVFRTVGVDFSVAGALHLEGLLEGGERPELIPALAAAMAWRTGGSP